MFRREVSGQVYLNFIVFSLEYDCMPNLVRSGILKCEGFLAYKLKFDFVNNKITGIFQNEKYVCSFDKGSHSIFPIDVNELLGWMWHIPIAWHAEDLHKKQFNIILSGYQQLFPERPSKSKLCHHEILLGGGWPCTIRNVIQLLRFIVRKWRSNC